MKPTSPAAGPIDPWEAAYLRFETPDEEIRKFIRRLRQLGAANWNRDAAIVELFCGRGNGLHALRQLGFRRVEGVDLSPTLAAQYHGESRVHVADCRRLPFPDASRDVAIVQGGLHHLPSLADFEATLAEVNRVLRPGGLFVAIEPWLTPFLRLVHGLCGVRLVRRLSNKFDALAVMIEHERTTYEQWLGQPQALLDLLQRRFRTERRVIRRGKLAFVGRNP